MAKLRVVRIGLSGPSLAIFKPTAARLHVTQLGMMSALVEWFALQPRDVQIAVLGLYPEEIEGDVAKLILGHRAYANITRG